MLPVDISLESVVPNDELIALYQGIFPSSDVQQILEETAALWIRDFSSKPPDETHPHILRAYVLASGTSVEPQSAPIVLMRGSDGQYRQTIVFSILPDQDLNRIGAAISLGMLWAEPLGSSAIPEAEQALIYVQSNGLGFDISLRTPLKEIAKSVLLYFGGSLLTLPGILAFLSSIKKRRAERVNNSSKVNSGLILPGDSRFSMPKGFVAQIG